MDVAGVASVPAQFLVLMVLVCGKKKIYIYIFFFLIGNRYFH